VIPGFIRKRISAGGVKYATTKRERAMSKMKEWLLDRQENGDDGTGYNDYNEIEGESNE
jgi:hypothetical protein